MDLTLTADQLDGLRKNVPKASEDDLQRAYSFEHPLNARRTLKRAWIDSYARATKFRWHLLFFEPTGNCILESRIPVARSATIAQLVSVETEGLVAANETLYLDGQYQNRRFATALYGAEMELYMRWGVQEIWLRAQRDGLVVWMKPEFGFIPIDRKFFRRRYEAWRRGSTLPADPIEYPEAFLKELQDVQLYKVIGS
jgi:hypothetical protein